MSGADKLIAIIPARGGSKRLPGKNTRSFFAHPMLAYGIAAALNSRLFARVVVSSDDATIGTMARWYGAEFVLRPLELASDTAQLTDVAIHALETVQGEGSQFEALCQIMPNCPLLRSEDIVEHWRLFRQDRKFQISVVPYRSVYPHWALVADEQQRGRWLFGKEECVRSQELPTAFCPTGAIWWARVTDFRAQKTFYGNPFHLAPMDPNRGIDIDTEEDLRLADLLVRGMKARDAAFPLERINRDTFFHPQGSLA